MKILIVDDAKFQRSNLSKVLKEAGYEVIQATNGREALDIVRKGDVGYVRDIGTFLQQFYIYAVEWVDRGTIVGMRGKELISADAAGTLETQP